MRSEIRLLESVKWDFLGLERETQTRIVRRVNRLGKEPRPRDAKRIAGTTNVYALKIAGRGVIYHELDGAVTLLAIRQGRKLRHLDAVLNSARAARVAAPTAEEPSP